jgi:hypothetical protein
LWYERDRLKLDREYARLRRRAAGVGDVISDLFLNGLVVLPDFMSSEQIERMTEKIPPIEACQLSTEGTFTRFYMNAANISDLKPFFENSLISRTMEGVLGPTVTMYRSTVQYRTEIGHTGAFEHFFHIDTWRPRYKAFLYLTDVGEDNGPFTYTPRTQYGTWRRRYDSEIARVFRAGSDGFIHDDASAYVGCLWPHEYEDLCSRLGTGPRTVTGKKGTLILFDARGLHKIRPLSRAPRIILSSYWIREGHHV